MCSFSGSVSGAIPELETIAKPPALRTIRKGRGSGSGKSLEPRDIVDGCRARPENGRLALVGAREHRSEVMLSVLEVVLRQPYCHFELQRGPAPNIAHSFVSCSESRSA